LDTSGQHVHNTRLMVLCSHYPRFGREMVEMVSQRQQLEPYNDMLVTITGVFQKFTTVKRGTGTITTALLQDAEVQAGGNRIDIGHTYLQNAEGLQRYGLMPGTRIRCRCRVVRYLKRVE